VQIGLLLALVRRDYKLQYAGSILGTGWLALEYSVQAFVFYVVFTIIFQKAVPPAHLLAGMLFWIPLAELFVKTSSSLTRHRNLIRRTTAGARYFSLIPTVQSLIQFLFLLALLAPLFLYWKSSDPLRLFAAAILGSFFLLLLGFPARILAWQSLILRDLGPLLRLLFQALFWTLPVVYTIPDRFAGALSWHPFAWMLSVVQFLLAGSALVPDWRPACLYLILFGLAHAIARRSLFSIARDEL
jgi:lipopolysaccharide transport system permease protein